MRRSIILSTILAASVAVLGACTETKVTENKPVATPAPVSTASPLASPAASPAASPVGSPAKPGASPEVKKDDGKNVNKDVKPAETPKK